MALLMEDSSKKPGHRSELLLLRRCIAIRFIIWRSCSRWRLLRPSLPPVPARPAPLGENPRVFSTCNSAARASPLHRPADSGSVITWASPTHARLHLLSALGLVAHMVAPSSTRWPAHADRNSHRYILSMQFSSTRFPIACSRMWRTHHHGPHLLEA